MKTKWRTIIGGIALALLLLIVSLKIIFFPPGPDIVCHKALDGCFSQWMLENKTNAYPNVQGESLKSLMVIATNFGPDAQNSFRDYVYIPGIQIGDPKNLILMYVRKKTRRTWHGDVATVFRQPNWLIIGADFDSPETPNSSEVRANELFNTQELRQRIASTLDYLRTNNRPNWQAVVAEQTKLLESVHD